ncbi:MAG TPA: NAD-dependent epimerase/dehydratase family protein [Ornithinimicrobium sp.]|uniref:NAD-dependent epimerase/dehydratase family protein n=1 Tax=Ornithinimicrobium sp. TaxID=1977084 RepID=UPI002B493477|nr:NAD-dependent epimerase/dehydratase family protein [Ornithinimicrobium sp.]HKJ11631.1 NAD-dependent epimerase/dehydratase family protein [Ornithinimicrobium sp.]
MTDDDNFRSPIVVTGANGLVGSHVCQVLSERGATVRAVVRRPGTAPRLPGLTEHVGDFGDAELATAVVQGAGAVVTTVHPMGAERSTQHQVGVVDTTTLVRAARDAGVPRVVHISTAAVYERSPEAGDIVESSPLVTDDAGDYAVTKRDTDAALAEVEGVTGILVRPPAILGAGESSMWNSIVPDKVAQDGAARQVMPDAAFAWVHVEDLAAFVVDLATGAIRTAGDTQDGPAENAWTPANVAAAPATARDYYGTVAEAVGVELAWQDGPAWTGEIRTDRARGWGWRPVVGLAQALSEIEAGLRSRGG